MRLVAHKSSFNTSIPSAWRPLQVELARNCQAVLALPTNDNAKEQQITPSSDSKVLHALSELQPTDLLINLDPNDKKNLKYPCHSAITLGPPRSDNELEYLNEAHSSAQLILSDRSPYELGLPSSILPRILEKFQYIPPSTSCKPSFPQREKSKVIVLQQASGIPQPLLESLLETVAEPSNSQIITLAPDLSLDEILDILANASWCLNDCRDSRLHLQVNLAAALLEVPCTSWIELAPTTKHLHWFLQLPTSTSSNNDPRATGKLRPAFQEAVKLAKMQKGLYSSWLTSNPELRIFSPKEQLRYICSILQSPRVAPPPGFETFDEFSAAVLRCPPNSIETETTRTYSSLYPSGHGYPPLFNTPEYRSSCKTFLYYWNQLPDDSKRKQQLKTHYQDQLQDYARFAVFRLPTIEGNTEFIELNTTLEDWLSACRSAQPLSPEKVNKESLPHRFNPFTPLSITEIVFGFLTPKLPSFFDPQKPTPADKLVDAADRLLEQETELGLDSPMTFTCRLYTAFARRDYTALNVIASTGTQRHGPSSALYGSAGILHAMHGNRDQSQSAFEKQDQDIEHLSADQLITFTGYSIFARTPVSTKWLQSMLSIPNLVERISNNPNLVFPMLLAISTFKQSRDLAERLWKRTIVEAPDCCNLRFLLDTCDSKSPLPHTLIDSLFELGQRILETLTSRQK